ncbi:aminoglycoside phosphotransferase [Microlunatus endophyticus]|uniref:Aminoglycoside phosphotransferase n=1 Tax=Microlunatus endophyticus TaxID=1716077 RepID=A0A917SGV3_9ACTN|nr:phosphotransferase [Microlunatus endophyticus]GGL76626.1 aminoglycoside phosphotransferase [Microlunatus endophyticus]
MEPPQAQRALLAATSTASALGLAVDEAVILNDSNRMVVRLMPCDTVVRVTPTTHHAGHQVSPEREVEVVRRLRQMDSPVAGLDTRVEPRVVERDGLKIAFWTYYERAQSSPIPPADYARALGRLHADLRHTEVATAHVMDRVAAVQNDVASHDLTPDLTSADRHFLASMLRDLSGSIAGQHPPEQLLHGEPHSMNVLGTEKGPLFIDFENTARGPVEYDLAWTPTEVSDCYPGADEDLVGECRGLVLAMVAAYRWRSDDQHPSGRESGLAFVNVLRAGPPWPALDDVFW